MSGIAKNTAETPATPGPERTKKTAIGILHDLIEEKIRAKLGPRNEQISRLTQILNHLIQESSARNSPTEDACTQQTQSRLSPSYEAATFRARRSTEFPPDINYLTYFSIIIKTN